MISGYMRSNNIANINFNILPITESVVVKVKHPQSE